MAILRGQGAFKDVNLIVFAPTNGSGKSKDGKTNGKYLDVQVDQSLKNPDKVLTGESQADTNPHLTSRKVQHPSGGEYVSHRVFYKQSQLEAIANAAGKNYTREIKGEKPGTVYGVRASLLKNAKGELLIDTSKEMTHSKNPKFTKTILERQAAVTTAAREFRDAQIQSEGSDVEAQAETTKDTPEV